MNFLKKAKDRYKSAPKGKRFTLKTVNKLIKTEFPDVTLVKGEGYFYIIGDTDEMCENLGQLQSTSIYSYHLTSQSPEQWLEDVRRIFNQIDDSRGNGYMD